MVPNLTTRPLFSPIYLNRTCANSANSAILIIKMLEMIGIMQKLHLYHRLVEKYQYIFFLYIYIYLFFLLFKMTGEALPHLPHRTARPCVSPVPLERGIQAWNTSLLFCCSSNFAAIVTTASPKAPWTETGASRSGAFSLSDSLASDSHRDLWVATAAPITLPSACDVHRVSLSDRSVARRSSATDG